MLTTYLGHSFQVLASDWKVTVTFYPSENNYFLTMKSEKLTNSFKGVTLVLDYSEQADRTLLPDNWLSNRYTICHIMSK